MRFAYLIGLWTLGWAAPALAEPTPEARAAAEALFLEGKALVEKSDLPPACERFAQSQKLDPQIGTLLYLATCHEQTGKTATAWIEFKDAQALAEASNKPDRIQQAKEGVDRVGATLSRATIKLTDPAPGQIVKVNGREQAVLDAPLPFDPGTLEISSEAPGRKPAKLSVELPKGSASIEVVVPALAMEAATPPKVEPREVDHTLAFIVGGAGLGLGAIGFALGGAAWGTSSSADDHCQGNACTQEGLDGHDTANALAWGSNVTLIAGTAALATGVILFFVYEPEAEPTKAALVPFLDPTAKSAGLLVGGAF